MNKQIIGSKIKELRLRKGYSQEQLSEDSSLSLRTIQRIEKGESAPYGDSLRKLAQALGVTPEAILGETITKELPEDKGYLTILNLSALAILVHPLLGVFLPLVLWLLKKDSVMLVNDTGKKLVSFQLSWALQLYVLIFLLNRGRYMVFDVSAFNVLANMLSSFTIEALAITAFYTYNICQIIVNLRRNQNGQESRYFPAVPFLR